MKVKHVLLAALLIALSIQTAICAQAQSASNVPAGSALEVVLAKPLDAKKSKTGDEVVGKVDRDFKVGDTVVISKNSKIMGHVTDAKARSKDQPQSLITIAFEHIVLKDGGDIPVTAIIQAIAKPNDDRSGEVADLMRGTGANQTLSSQGQNASDAGGQVGQAATVLTLKTQGVLGYNGLGIQGSTIFSPMQNVHLDGGTSMIVQVTAK